jgi:hypothetical protein
MELKELKNGRAAMIGFAALVRAPDYFHLCLVCAVISFCMESALAMFSALARDAERHSRGVLTAGVLMLS